MGSIPDLYDEDDEKHDKRYAIGGDHGNALLQDAVAEPQKNSCGRGGNPGKAYVTGLPRADHPVSLGEKCDGRQYSRGIAKIFCFNRHLVHIIVMGQVNTKIRNYREIVCWRVSLWQEGMGNKKTGGSLPFFL
jgi:hypothetical protein